MDDARLSRGERAGLGRLSRDEGDVVERAMDGPLTLLLLLPRPLSSFSLPERWEEGGVRDEGLRDEGDEEERRTCDAESERLRHGIFSRLTTGRDTLDGGNGKRLL